MILKSRQVNTDPEPWVYPDGCREHAVIHEGDSPEHSVATYAPRSEFEPTRDPRPWASHRDGDVAEWNRGPSQHNPDWYWWRPRREQFDHPVNPALELYREGPTHPLPDGVDDLEAFLEELDLFTPDCRDRKGRAWSSAEIDHAHRVLTRLATMKRAA